MTPADWTAIAYFIVIPLLGAAWRQWRKDVANVNLRAFVDDLVGSAEEMKASNKLNGIEKGDWVRSRILQKYPKLPLQEVEIMIAAALNAAGLGASAPGRKKPSMDMDIPG